MEIFLNIIGVIILSTYPLFEILFQKELLLGFSKKQATNFDRFGIILFIISLLGIGLHLICF